MALSRAVFSHSAQHPKAYGEGLGHLAPGGKCGNQWQAIGRFVAVFSFQIRGYEILNLKPEACNIARKARRQTLW